MNENLVQYVLDAQKGDVDAFAKLYSRTLKNSYYLALKLAADKPLAEEIFKKAYAVAFCSVDKLKRPEAFENWIKQKIAAAFKETQSFVFSDAEGETAPLSSEFLPARVLDDAELCKRIEAQVDSLPVEQRTVSVLYYCVGMPVDYIAKFLSVSQSTVNSLLFKARIAVADVVPDSEDPISEEAYPVLTRIFKRSAADTAIDNNLVRKAFVFAVDTYENRNNPAPVKEEEVKEPVQEAEEKPAEPVEAVSEPAAEEPLKIFDEPVSAITGAIGFDPASVLDEKAVEPQTELVLPVIDETETDKKDVIDSVIEPKTIVIPADEKPSDAVTTGDDLLKEIEKSIADLNNDPEYGPPVNLPEVTGEYISTDAPETQSYEEEQAYSDVVTDEPKPAKKLNVKLIAVIAAVLVIAGIIAGAAFAKHKKAKQPETTTPPAVTAQEGKTYKKKILVLDKLSQYSDIYYLSEDFCVIEVTDPETLNKAYGLMDYEGNVLAAPSEDYAGFIACSDGRVYSDDRDYHYLVQLRDSGKYYRIVESKLGVDDQFYELAEHEKETVVTDDNLEKSKFYDERDRTHNNCTAVRDKNTQKWGYVDMNGKIVIDCNYEPAIQNCDPSVSDYCYPVSTDGLVPVRKNGKMGIVDTANNTVVDFSYETILPGENGVFIAKNVEGWCFILIGSAIDNFNAADDANTDPNAPALPEGATAFTGKYQVNNYDGLNIRAEMDIYSDKVGEVSYEEVVDVFGKGTDSYGEEWYYIHFFGSTNNDLYGWAKSKNFELATTEAIQSAEQTSSTEQSGYEAEPNYNNVY